MRQRETVTQTSKPKIFERLHKDLRQYKLKYKGCVRPEDFKNNHEQIEKTFFSSFEEREMQVPKDYSMTL